MSGAVTAAVIGGTIVAGASIYSSNQQAKAAKSAAAAQARAQEEAAAAQIQAQEDAAKRSTAMELDTALATTAKTTYGTTKKMNLSSNDLLVPKQRSAGISLGGTSSDSATGLGF